MTFESLTKDEIQVFDVLQKNGPITKKNLEQCLGWTPSTTNRAIQSLLGKHAILEIGYEDSSGGRRPGIYSVNSKSGYFLGIHIGYGSTHIILCDIQMHILTHECVVLPLIWHDPIYIVKVITATANDILDHAGISKNMVIGAGLAIIGPLHRDMGETGTIMSFDKPVSEWCNVPIRDMISESMGLPVVADNACNAGALAEYLYGEGRGRKSISYIVCEVGITSGQITNGHIVRRQDDREDGLSHISVNMLGPYCSCGKRGCILQYASTTAIRNVIRMRISNGASTRIPLKNQNHDFTFLDYEEAAKQGDTTVIDELRTAGYYMGHALSNYINLLTPDYLVLGGVTTERLSFFYDSVLHMLVRYHGEDIKKKIRFKKSGSFGESTVALGAAAMYYEKMIGNPIMD